MVEGYRDPAVTSDVPVEFRKVIGKEARVYTLDVGCFSMAPGCELESFMSFSLGRDYHEILFESPERARSALQQQGLNYFLFDLGNDTFGLDILQHSPLFQPGNIEKHLQVRWCRNNVFLLTWANADTYALPEDTQRLYAKLLDKPAFGIPTRPLYDQVRLIYEMNGRRAFPVNRPPSLPPVIGWQ